MGNFIEKPEWIDPDEDGEFECDNCAYKSNNEEYLKSHQKSYHNDKTPFILYMCCQGSIDERNIFEQAVTVEYIDCTGPQAAFHDGDLQQFGNELVQCARDNDLKLYCIYRMYDPGLGLMINPYWLKGGLDAGVFTEYSIPDDVKANDDQE